MFKVGIVGVGNMGEAILRGILSKSLFSSSDIVVYDKNSERVEYIVDKYEVAAATDIRNLVNLSEIIFLCVKPKDFKQSIWEARELFTDRQTIISVMAGVTIEKLKDIIKAGHIVRTMPNTPALIGEGVIGVSFDFSDTFKKNYIKDILSSLGMVVEVEEHLLDVITGLSGSGPAYVFVFIDALAQAGVKMGLSYKQALDIATQTVIGSAKLLKETGQHPCILRDNVTSPAGTTIYALHELEKRGFRDSVISAVETATKRSKELS